MSQPRLIGRYLADLAAELPPSIVEELADGLTETYRAYLRQGLPAERAAAAAVAEFGEPRAIVAGFARVNPVRRAARRLLGFGPAVGACWLAALFSGRPWAVPGQARLLVGLTLAAIIGLLAAAALGSRYRRAARTGAAGFCGVIALDSVLILGVTLARVPVTWLLGLAMAASAGRIAFAARALRPALAA
jgi:hypothetical protein